MTNLVEIIQNNLGYPALQKIDPNNQETKHFQQTTEEKLAQSVVPVVLTAIFKLTRNDIGCRYILSGEKKEDKFRMLYNFKVEEVIERVMKYAGVSAEVVETRMKEVANESFKVINKMAGGATEGKIKDYMSGQRHNILVHLPAAMQLGDLLKDDTLDDRTNKMEGPVSGFVHRVENIFSGGGE